jgi:EmrB/QacA subfamily drug resistance transporter
VAVSQAAPSAEARPTLTRRQTVLLVASLMLGTALAALDTTIVGTAMPTIVGALGGVELYSWVITAYLLTSTTTVPLYGRLADLYGRKPVYLFGIVLFLVGSALCGLAATMEQLIAFRALQGIGAGAILPMGMTILGDTFGIEQRARIQAFTTAVWGTSSVVGPATGALIVTYLHWGWVFLVNVPVGIAAIAMLNANYHERVAHRERSIDWFGAGLLTAAIALLLLGLQRSGVPRSSSGTVELAGLFAGALAMGVAFVLVELRTPDPVMPLGLFARPLIGVGYLASFLLGAVQFGVASFVPLYVQGAMGGDARSVGLTVMPMAIGWPIGAIASGRLIVRVGYRRVLLAGMSATALGAAALLTLTPSSSMAQVMLPVGVVGLGMGLSNSPIVIALQNAVVWNRRGIITSLVQFFRSIGGSCGVALMGAVVNLELAGRVGDLPARTGAALGRRGDVVSQLLDPATRAGLGPEVVARVQAALADALWDVYLFPAACALLGLVLVVVRFPSGSVQQLAARDGLRVEG